MKKSKVTQGNNIDILKEYPDNHFDSIVTDPPYGIEFLTKEWDKSTGAVETWAECFRVLKPGGYLLAFSAARTYHNLATNIEGVGFEIRDQLMWLYASGFPKAQDMGKAIDKRMGKHHKTNTYEQDSPITETKFMKSRACIVCGSRSKDPNGIGFYCGHSQEVELEHAEAKQWKGWKTALKPAHEPIVMARKPFKGSTIDNVLNHGVGALNIDATRIHTNETLQHSRTGMNNSGAIGYKNIGEYTAPDNDNKGDMWKQHEQGRFPSNVIGEVEGYQKFFYCPKVNHAERHIGFETVGNNHPTVKPVALMKYLVKLVTPQGGKILDPFCGSGSTGMAAVELDYNFTGCELDPAYVNIANLRITAWKNKTDLENNPLPEQWFEEE